MSLKEIQAKQRKNKIIGNPTYNIYLQLLSDKYRGGIEINFELSDT